MKKSHISVLLLAAALGACGHPPTPPASAPAASPTKSTSPIPAETSRSTLSEAEKLYGVSPRLSNDIKYQPDVIVMEHGSSAIRSQSTDGFTWTLDANAPGASQIKPDKVLFATGRVVGRVVKVERKGDDLDVTLGPVELTDIFEEVHITKSGAMDPQEMLVYVAPADYPGSYQDRDEAEGSPPAASAPHRKSKTQVYTVSRSGDLIPLVAQEQHATSPACASGAYALGSARTLQTAYAVPSVFAHDEDRCGMLMNTALAPGDIAAVILGGLSFSPSMNGGGIQFEITSKTEGLTFNAHAQIKMNQPKFTFRLDILHGLKTAAIELSGVGGIDVSLEAGTNGSLKNINKEFSPMVDISYPIPGIPFAATFHQSVLVQTLFRAKQATLTTHGDYSLGGKITAGLINGAPSASAPLFVTSNTNLGSSLKGVSLGANGIVLGYGGKLIIGLGSFGFIVGPYASINTSLGITRGSDLATGLVAFTCRSATLILELRYGVGFAIPEWSADMLNAFTGLFGAKPVSPSYSKPLGTIPIKSLPEWIPPSCEKPAT
jgi:hypothetical protein